MKEKITAMIEQYETIIIHRHERPDEDAYGSQCGLAEIIKASYPDKKVYVVGEEAEYYHYLYRLDQLTDDIWQGALAIVTDTANTERIDDGRYTLAEKLIKIDHHPNRDPYGDICWVDTNASSTCEMVYEWYLSGKESGLVCTDKAALLLYAGIVGDTGRFLHSSTTSKTFQYASELVAYDFDRSQLYRDMYDEPLNMVQLKGYVLENFEILPHGVGKIFITKAVREQFQVTAADCSRLVSELGAIKGIVAWALFTEADEGEIRVNLRSKGPAINGVAEKYRGGGHPMASGANIADWATAEALLQDMMDCVKTI